MDYLVGWFKFGRYEPNSIWPVSLFGHSVTSLFGQYLIRGIDDD